VSHFLGKPYQEDDLLEKISGFLRARKAAADRPRAAGRRRNCARARRGLE